MREETSRTEELIGAAGMKKLEEAHVAVFGLGGVGGYAVEALARAGVGTLTLVDHDRISISNRNRQILALASTTGRYKTEVMQERIMDINPDAVVFAHQIFFLPNTVDFPDFSQFSYVVDAIDTVSGKLEILTRAAKAGVPVISCMGTGNKLDPEKLCITKLEDTAVCPLARAMRRACRQRGLTGITVLSSTEEPVRGADRTGETTAAGRPVPGSISFVPSVAGLMMAGKVIRDLI